MSTGEISLWALGEGFQMWLCIYSCEKKKKEKRLFDMSWETLQENLFPITIASKQIKQTVSSVSFALNKVLNRPPNAEVCLVISVFNIIDVFQVTLHITLHILILFYVFFLLSLPRGWTKAMYYLAVETYFVELDLQNSYQGTVSEIFGVT